MVEQQVRKAWQRKHRKSWNKSSMHIAKVAKRKAKKDKERKQQEKYNSGVKP